MRAGVGRGVGVGEAATDHLLGVCQVGQLLQPQLQFAEHSFVHAEGRAATRVSEAGRVRQMGAHHWGLALCFEHGPFRHSRQLCQLGVRDSQHLALAVSATAAGRKGQQGHDT